MKCKHCYPKAMMELVKEYSTIDDYIWRKNYHYIWKCPWCGRKEKYNFGRRMRYGEREEQFEELKKNGNI